MVQTLDRTSENSILLPRHWVNKAWPRSSTPKMPRHRTGATRRGRGRVIAGKGKVEGGPARFVIRRPGERRPSHEARVRGRYGSEGCQDLRGIALRHNANPHLSGVTDPEPQNGPESSENPSDGGEIGNRVTDATEFGNPRNPDTPIRKTRWGVTDVTEEYKTFEKNSLRERGFGKTVTLVTWEAFADVRRLTPEEVDRALSACVPRARRRPWPSRGIWCSESAHR